jgi:hypothetical protein
MEIVQENNLSDFIKAQLAKVNEGVWEARKAGLNVLMPEALQFDVTVIRKWQSEDLEIVGKDTTKSTDTGGGTSTSIQEGSGSRVSTDKGESTRQGRDNSTSAGTNANYTYTED